MSKSCFLAKFTCNVPVNQLKVKLKFQVFFSSSSWKSIQFNLSYYCSFPLKINLLALGLKAPMHFSGYFH